MSISLQFQLQRHLVVAVDHERAQDLRSCRDAFHWPEPEQGALPKPRWGS